LCHYVPQREQFAVAMALGQNLSAWAKKHGVPKRTCYNWRKSKEYKQRLEKIRWINLDQAVA
jgi:hypothetical protein